MAIHYFDLTKIRNAFFAESLSHQLPIVFRIDVVTGRKYGYFSRVFIIANEDKHCVFILILLIFYCEVHKAASSTVQNIFLRFGWYRNLTFVLSPAKNSSGYPNIISLRESLTNSNILPPPEGRHYDILCNHVFYTNEAFRKFMPNDAVFIGILRESFDLYKSILNHFRPAYIYKKISDLLPASTFLRDPLKYEPERLISSWTKGRKAIEYGFPPELFSNYNKTGIDMYLEKLNKEFKLILIAEYMDESVILMRRYLNWNSRHHIIGP